MNKKRKYVRPAGHFPQTKEGWQEYLNQEDELEEIAIDRDADLKVNAFLEDETERG